MLTDKQRLERLLAQVRRQLADGQRQMARQRKNIKSLEREGRSAAEAHKLLDTLEVVQVWREKDRQRCERELAALRDPGLRRPKAR